MESVEVQQGAETAVSETETQHITQAQIATLAQVTMTTGHVSATGPTVTLVQLPNGQTVQVHGVIQAAQPSVIQSPQIQTVQISSLAESEDSQESVDSVTDSQKRREILSRRPSYRKILNDLSSDAPGVPRIEEERAEEDSSAVAATHSITTVTVPTPIYQTSSGQYSSRHHTGWSHSAGQQRHGRSPGPPDSDHDQRGSNRPARSHHPAVRADQRRPADTGPQ
uniref:cyclic AMP-responsive element-binding protein 1b isoform X2 n=1 Tax=Gasterosteus aculeatus aculeatus TaxID=481459 RepID=UPI001A98BA7D|nr:cyclic AMP-responsive element-binding protein 1b isoform X2 [Gasterosteus aculeatus aculeatus]